MAAALGPDAMRPEVATVIDFYRGTLRRLPDDNGLAYWVNRFRVAQCHPTDLGGFGYWVDELAGGRTRDAVRRAFIDSFEFGQRVVGIVAAGCTSPMQ